MPLVDPGPLERYTPGQMPDDDQLSYIDANNFLGSGQGLRRTAVFGVSGALEPARSDLGVINTKGAATTADFFQMFNVPFLHGAGWSAADDERAV